MPTLVAIHHIAFRTQHLTRLAEFYSSVFSLSTERVQEGRSVWLLSGETRIMLEQKAPHEPDPNPGSMDLVTFRISAAERHEFEARLAARGIALEGQTAYSLYFRDPDGRRVGVSHYPDEVSPQAR